MSTIFGSFEAAKSGLSTSLLQRNVTEQNIANANTKGYTRQRAITSAKEPNSSNYLIAPRHSALVGQGVEVTKVTQIRSQYLDAQYRKLSSDYFAGDAVDEAMTYLCGVLNELDEDAGLTVAIKNFYSALNTFTSDPSSREYRTNVQQQAQALTDTFNTIYNEMMSLWEDQNASIKTDVEQINAYAEKIANLNLAIARATQAEAATNDLKDELNLLLDELSEYVDIEFEFKANDTVDVYVGGHLLVSGRYFNKLNVTSKASEVDAITAQIAQLNRRIMAAPEGEKEAIALERSALIEKLADYGFTVQEETGGEEGAVSLKLPNGRYLVNGTQSFSSAQAMSDLLPMDQWVAFSQNTVSIDVAAGDGTEPLDFGGAVKGGRLYGHMRMAGSLDKDLQGIPFYMNELNELARAIAQDINDIHQQGYTYPYDGKESRSGINFFHVASRQDEGGNTIYDYSTLTAGNLRLSDEVKESPFNIAASDKPIDLSAGSTESGNNLNARRLFETLSQNGYYDRLNSIVADLAIETDTVQNIKTTKNTLLISVDTQRQSLSSVSMDEETTNLIMFQQTYNACARVVTTISEMIDTLINRMGV